MYPVHPRYRQPLTEKQIRLLYDYYVNRLVPCLQAEGYDVGPVPTWEFFLANYKPIPWDPYRRLSPVRTRMSPSEYKAFREKYKALRKKCPPRPPITELFPDDET